MTDGFDTFDENIVKTLKETDKKCPQCAGTMSYDPATRMLKCPYCNHTQEIVIDSINDTVEELDFDDAVNMDDQSWGVEKKKVICKQCGAEAIYDALQTSAVCEYCGSNQVMEASAEDTVPPNGVVGFLITMQEAGSRFTKWLKGKIFTPSKAKKSAKPDAFKGIYLPYWTFDANTTTSYTARYGINRTTTDSKGNTRTYTDWYSTSGVYSEFIDDCLVCGTDRHNSDIIDRINPFDTSKCKPYDPEYVSGFISERYTIGIKSAWEKAKSIIQSRLRNNIENKILSEHNADKVDSLRMNTNYYNKKYKYIVLPVWMSSFVYKNKVFRFMVNGQTGKVGGKAPVSPLRVAVAVVLGLAVLAGLVWLSNS